MRLQLILTEKINQLLNAAGGGKRIIRRPKVEIRGCNSNSYSCRVLYDSQENKAIFYFDSKFSKMLPITQKTLLVDLIVSCVQQIFWGNQSQGENRNFLQKMYKSL